MINELIEQIGGRERLEDIKSRIEMYGHGAGYTADEVKLMARALLAVLNAQAATHECNASPFKKFEIVWLGKCRCGNKFHTASTIRGGCDRLYDDDEVTCNACGRRGVIQCCEGYAGVLWETELERTTPQAASAPDGLSAAVNRLLDSDGSRGTFSSIRRGDALAEVERLLAAAPAPGGDGG